VRQQDAQKLLREEFYSFCQTQNAKLAEREMQVQSREQAQARRDAQMRG
jgi:hypothetical protein